MKESIFNSKIRLTDNLLAIYNALNDKTIFIAKNRVDIDDLSNSPALTLEQLKANGLLLKTVSTNPGIISATQGQYKTTPRQPI